MEDSFTATYHLYRKPDQAEAAARDICIEQTVEFPEDLIESDRIRSVFGQIRSLDEVGEGLFEVVIGFPVEVAGGELTQLVNVLFGNISLKPGICLRSFELPSSLYDLFRGPRFGRPGLRELLHVPARPLLASAIKPMGSSPAELAEQAYQLALGGMDLIKDDHGLTDQIFCPYSERVARCAEAVERANSKTGHRCLYFPNVTAPADKVMARALEAVDAGAGGLVISPGLTGLDTMRRLADDDRLSLPLLSHPAFQGAFVVASPRSGLGHGAVFGQLNRLAGADATIFPSFGGRFSFTETECRDLVSGTLQPMGPFAPIFPVPAGGMSLTRVRQLLEFYGSEVILLIGGDLHRHDADLVGACQKFLALVDEETDRIAATNR